MASIVDPANRYWRTGTGTHTHEIYALIFNDVTKPSNNDMLIGSMDSSDLADKVVELHNLVAKKFGRHYEKALKADE